MDFFGMLGWAAAVALGAAALLLFVRVDRLRMRARTAEERLQAHLSDWETFRAEAAAAAKAGALEVSAQLSNKLLDDHKREMETAKKAQEQIAKKTTEHLMEQFLSVTKTVASLKDQTADAQQKMTQVMRALTTPAEAGAMAEIGLENTLKNFALESPRDYVMQYAITGGEGAGLRPDAVIFLPQDMVMVIDSKASKFLFDAAQAQGMPQEQEACAALKRTMQTHVQALKSKDYASAISSLYKTNGRDKSIGQVFTVMYVPSESLIELLKRTDAEFTLRAERSGILVVGPSGLSGLLSVVTRVVGLARQAENQETIVHLVQELMDNIVTVLGYAASVGKGIKSAAEHYDAFARSANSRLLRKLRQLADMGVAPAKAKELPKPLTSYDVRPMEQAVESGEEDAAPKIAAIK